MTIVIAEFGSSPAPDWYFWAWCEAAAASHADAVKVQLFCAEHFPVEEQASKRPLVFPRERFGQYLAAARGHRLQAGASVFDVAAVALAAANCDFLKLAAREQDNLTLRLRVMQTGKPCFRSISTLGGHFQGRHEVTLFALPRYPAPLGLSLLWLLRAAAWFKRRRVRWGWSSHTTSSWDAVWAARLGAEAVEKHFALERTDLEAGHSLLPDPFKRMTEIIHGKN